MMVLAEEEDPVDRTAACGSGGGGGVGRRECFEPSLLPASPDGGDIWGGPLEPSALGGLPILVLCVLGLVSVAWTAFGAATSSGREVNSNKEARVMPTSRSGERNASPPAPPAPPTPPPPSPPSGGQTAVAAPPRSAEATTPRARSGDNHGIIDEEGEHSAKVSSSFGRRLSRPDSAAGGGGDGARLEHRGGGSAAGNGGVGMFFNGSAGRREGAGARVDVDSLGGGVGGAAAAAAAGRGRRPSGSGRLADDDNGYGDGASSTTCGENNGWGPDVWKEGEDSWRTSSIASSSVADASLLEDAAAAADRDGAVAAARRAEARATHDGIGLVVAADSNLEQRHAAGAMAPRSPAGAAAAAAAGRKDEDKTGAGGAEALAAADKEWREKEEDERRLLSTVRGLLVELEDDLDAARVLMPECNRFRKVVRCVAEAVGPGMDARPRQAMNLIEALREATEFSRTLSSPEAFLVVMAELLLDGFEDPPAMLGYCTRRLCCAVAALPEPSSSSASRATAAVAARAQLCSLARGGTAASGGGGGGSSTGSTRSSLASSATLAAAATVAAAAAVLTPEPPATAASPTSTATVGVTPVSVSATWAPQDRPSLLLRASVAGGRESGTSNGSGAEEGWRAGETEGGANAAAAAAAAAASTVGGAAAAATAERQPAAADCGDESGTGGRAGTSGDCGKDDLDGNGSSLRSRMGPALTSEAAGLSELIRRRGGLSALSDGRAVAAVLRAAAPRRQNAFHLQHPPQQQQQQQQRQARSFFDIEAE
ncbi:unnamed protein product, partial [Ectocarpus fasciculatus]